MTMIASTLMAEFVVELLARHELHALTAGQRLEVTMDQRAFLSLEQIDPHLLRMAYQTPRVTGESASELEIRFFLDPHGGWIPFAISRPDSGNREWGDYDPATAQLVVTDAHNQEALAAYCDAWTFHLREQGWLINSQRVDHSPSRTKKRVVWPKPTTDEPDLETLEEWMWDGMCEATDSCIVEPDGVCPHGHPSWLLRLGLI